MDPVAKDSSDVSLFLIEENKRLQEENDNLKRDVKGLSEKVISLGETIKKKEKIWGYLESRFVEVCRVCSTEEKAKCIMFPEYCEGECKETIDLLALLEKAVDRGEVK